MVLRKTANNLPKLIRDEAADRQVALRANGKLQIDERVKAAQAAGDLGSLAYFGDLAATGILDSQFQDHGTSENILEFNDVVWGDRTVDSQFTVYDYGLGFPSDRFDVGTAGQCLMRQITTLDSRAIEQLSDLNTYTPFNRTLYATDNHVPGRPYVWSIYATRFGTRNNTTQIRVRSFPTALDAYNQTNAVTIATGTAQALTGGSGTSRQAIRHSVAFITTSADVYIQLEVRSQRNAGSAAGVIQESAWWTKPMLEEVQLGQTKPSKFVLPAISPGDVAAQLIEGDAMLGFISGLKISQSGGTSFLNDTEGRAYIPGIGKIANMDYTAIPSGPTTNGRFYAYLWEDDSGTALLDFSSTSPTIYTGSARYVGDNNNRYVGFLPRYLGAIPNFRQASDEYLFLYYDNNANRIVLNAGSAIVGTTVDCSAFAPTQARILLCEFHLFANTAGGSAQIGNPSDGLAKSSGEGQISMSVGLNTFQRQRFIAPIVCNASQQLSYACSVAGVDLTIKVMGFWEGR